MNWLQLSKKFEEENIYVSDVITCAVLRNNYTITEKDDLESWKISEDTFKIFASYIDGWLCETEVSYPLATEVLDFLRAGLINKIFTLKDVEVDNDIVRDYINDNI